jgi:hypothetical protein
MGSGILLFRQNISGFQPPSAWGPALRGKALGVVADDSQLRNENRFHALSS